MLFLSNFGRKIIFTCSVNFWHPQDSNSFSLKQALITWPLSASELSSKVTITLSWKQLFLACLWHWKIFMSDQLFAPPIEGFNCLFFLPFWRRKMSSYYNYFEKGCRKKCARQSWKVLWVVLSSLFCVLQRNLTEWQERP